MKSVGTNKIVLGCQWGDEGKGKIVDLLAAEADVVARFQGGANAGHTIVIDDNKYILHLIPSGIMHPGKECYVGNGVVLDPFAFREEIDLITDQGIDYRGRLWVSPAVNLVMPYHKLIEDVEERARGATNLGTTKRGIGPAYVDKVARQGVRVIDLFSPERLKKKLDYQNKIKAKYLEGSNDQRADLDRIHHDLLELAELFRLLVVDVSLALRKAYDDDKKMLFEGAQGCMLDVDLGTYPFTTSSNTTVGGALTGLGIGPKMIDEVVGVIKAYTTRVGAGPFPTELVDKTGEHLRETGQEFGASTGRPRRCGWLDMVILRHGVRVNGVDSIAITKLDVLDDLEEIKVCTAYELDGQTTDQVPLDLARLGEVKPIYQTLPGWRSNSTGAASFNDLPAKARDYLKFITHDLKVDIALVSTGAKRTETIVI